MKNNQTNYYEILGVSKEATPQEIKKAYRELSKVHHPDKGGDEQVMAEIAEAYEILSNPAKRKEFDETGEVQKERNHMDMLSQMISQNLIPIILNNVNNPEVDIIEEFNEGLQTLIDNAEEALKEKEKQIDGLTKMVDKIKSKGEENIVKAIVEATIDGHKSNCDSIRKDIEGFMWCQEFMTNYSYDVVNLIGEDDISDIWQKIGNRTANRFGGGIHDPRRRH